MTAKARPASIANESRNKRILSISHFSCKENEIYPFVKKCKRLHSKPRLQHSLRPGLNYLLYSGLCFFEGYEARFAREILDKPQTFERRSAIGTLRLGKDGEGIRAKVLIDFHYAEATRIQQFYCP